MRVSACVLLILGLVATPAPGQVNKATAPAIPPAASSGAAPRPKLPPPGYRMNMANGTHFLIKSHRIEGKNYVVNEMYTGEAYHPIAGVSTIVELTSDELGQELLAYPMPEKAPSRRVAPRTAPRTAVRTQARSAGKPPEAEPALAPAPVREPDPVPSSEPGESPARASGGSNLRTTPMGFQLHMGPRGGIYHYSKNGKKVYQKR